MMSDDTISFEQALQEPMEEESSSPVGIDPQGDEPPPRLMITKMVGATFVRSRFYNRTFFSDKHISRSSFHRSWKISSHTLASRRLDLFTSVSRLLWGLTVRESQM